MITHEVRELDAEVSALGLNKPAGIKRSQVAVCILPGGNVREGRFQHTRLTEAPWQLHTDDLWVCGTRRDPEYRKESIKWHVSRDGVQPLRLETQLYAEHTPGQMHWVAMLLLDNPHIHHLLVSTADYHLNRGIQTFIKIWQDDGRKLSIGRLPTPDPPPEALVAGSSTSQSRDEELERIVEYQAKGHVATTEEFHRFMAMSA
jgi:hypothetical protein